MGDKNPKTTHKQAAQKQVKTDAAKLKKDQAEAAKHPDNGSGNASKKG